MNELYGIDLFGLPVKPPSNGIISDKFTLPPFSVLNARDGFWQERKAAWLSYGITGEVGRKENLTQVMPMKNYSADRMQEEYYDEGAKVGTSVFDPVLCELAYRWFCPPGGQILDPFAGGSVRGIVASLLGFRYWGCDLRPEQTAANEEQANEILKATGRPEWVCGDSMDRISTHAPPADFVFSCPPYGDLEQYSDDPRDLSNMEWHTFLATYKRIILRSCMKLRDNRFACFVVGDFRDDRGFYRNFVSETITAFLECGLKLYNEGILVTAVGSASMRVARIFNGGRKFCKTHQNVLVFVKGDPKKATHAIITT